MSGEARLRQAAERIKADLSGSAYDEAAAMPRDELLTGLETEIFMTSMYRKPSFAASVTSLMADLLVDENGELRSVWNKITIDDIEDLSAFNLLLDEMLLARGSGTDLGHRRLGITTVEGVIAGWASVIGARTARCPDSRPLWSKLAARLRGWRLIPPLLSDEEATKRAKGMVEAVSSPFVDPYLAERVFRMIAEHATKPMQPAIHEIIREISSHHMNLLTILHRAADHLLKLSVRSRGERRFFTMFMTHVAYRGLLIGYRHSLQLKE